jgi:hypothetical protein
MGDRFISSATTQAGLALLLVAAVALLTLVFSFLGTILCSVLVGMMIAAIKPRLWRALLVSLVFPAVLLGFLRFSKADLPPHKGLQLASVCFGAFWLTCLSSRLLMVLEAPSAGPPAPPAAPPQGPPGDPHEAPLPGAGLREGRAAGSPVSGV